MATLAEQKRKRLHQAFRMEKSWHLESELRLIEFLEECDFVATDSSEILPRAIRIENDDPKKDWMLKVLFSHGADANVRTSDFGTPLHLAVVLGSHAIVNKLLKHGASVAMVDSSGRTAVALAMHLLKTSSDWPDGYAAKFEAIATTLAGEMEQPRRETVDTTSSG